MWNLEKWHRLTFLQGKNRDTDREQIMDIVWEGEGETNYKNSMKTYTCHMSNR